MILAVFVGKLMGKRHGEKYFLKISRKYRNVCAKNATVQVKGHLSARESGILDRIFGFWYNGKNAIRVTGDSSQ